MTIQESFYHAQFLERMSLKDHKTIDKHILVDAIGPEIGKHFSYNPGLARMITRSGLYVNQWIRVFFATIWIDRNHEWFQFRFEGLDYRLYVRDIIELFGFLESYTRIHSLCYGTKTLLDTLTTVMYLLHHMLHSYGHYSLRALGVHKWILYILLVLHGVVTRTMLPHMGYGEALTGIQ